MSVAPDGADVELVNAGRIACRPSAYAYKSSLTAQASLTLAYISRSSISLPYERLISTSSNSERFFPLSHTTPAIKYVFQLQVLYERGPASPRPISEHGL